MEEGAVFSKAAVKFLELAEKIRGFNVMNVCVNQIYIRINFARVNFGFVKIHEGLQNLNIFL